MHIKTEAIFDDRRSKSFHFRRSSGIRILLVSSHIFLVIKNDPTVDKMPKTSIMPENWRRMTETGRWKRDEKKIKWEHKEEHYESDELRMVGIRGLFSTASDGHVQESMNKSKWMHNCRVGSSCVFFFSLSSTPSWTRTRRDLCEPTCSFMHTVKSILYRQQLYSQRFPHIDKTPHELTIRWQYLAPEIFKIGRKNNPKFYLIASTEHGTPLFPLWIPHLFTIYFFLLSLIWFNTCIDTVNVWMWIVWCSVVCVWNTDDGRILFPKRNVFRNNNNTWGDKHLKSMQHRQFLP